MTTPKNRTSARQAAARQRIAQRDSPAGSDPPNETNMKWTTNPTRTIERDIVVSMVTYLREDPTVNEDLDVFRFICRDWYVLERTLHTKATMDTVKRRLLALGIRYIHRTSDQNWYYWNDYSPLAIMEFYPVSGDMDRSPTVTQRRPDTEQFLQDVSQDVPTLTEPTIPFLDTPPRLPHDSTAMTAPTGHERLSLETMPIAPPRQSTSQSGAASINIGGHTTDSSESEDTSTDEDEVVYIRTQKPVTTEDDSEASVDNTRPRSTFDKQDKPPDTQSNWNEEGFTTVRTRQERRQRKSQTPSTPSADRKQPATQNRGNPVHVASTVKASLPPTEIRITAQRDDYSNMEEQALQLPVPMDTLTEILQERLEEMTAKIDRREQQLIDELRNAEERLHKNERKASTERQHHRNYIDQTMKRLEDWEENLLQREQTIERNRKTLHAQYDRYTNQYTEWQQQATRAITAWHEVAQTTLKETLDATIQQQTVKINDFATDQEQKLVSLLDGYEEHARGIQAKLLARFHADTIQKYTDARNMDRQQDAIPLDDDEPPALPSDPPLFPTADDDTTHPAQKASRWIHVNPALRAK
jgi:hypothetical protein